MAVSSFLQIDFTTLNSNTVQLSWPQSLSGSEYSFSDIIQITDSVAGASIVMPDETSNTPGAMCYIINSSDNPVTIRSSDNSAIISIGTKSQVTNVYMLVLSNNILQAPLSWITVPVGESLSRSLIEDIVGNGLLYKDAEIFVNYPIVPSLGSIEQTLNDRDSLILMGNSLSTQPLSYTLKKASVTGNGFYVIVKNNMSQGLPLTILTKGTDIISSTGNGTVSIAPGESISLISDGLTTYFVLSNYNAKNFRKPNTIDLSHYVDPTPEQASASIQLIKATGAVTSTVITYPQGYGYLFCAVNTTGSDIQLKVTNQNTSLTLYKNSSSFCFSDGNILATLSNLSFPNIEVTNDATVGGTFYINGVLTASGDIAINKNVNLTSGSVSVSNGSITCMGSNAQISLIPDPATPTVCIVEGFSALPSTSNQVFLSLTGIKPYVEVSALPTKYTVQINTPTIPGVILKQSSKYPPGDTVPVSGLGLYLDQDNLPYIGGLPVTSDQYPPPIPLPIEGGGTGQSSYEAAQNIVLPTPNDRYNTANHGGLVRTFYAGSDSNAVAWQLYVPPGDVRDDTITLRYIWDSRSQQAFWGIP